MENNNSSPQGGPKQPERDGGARKNRGFNKNYKNNRNSSYEDKGEQRPYQNQNRKNNNSPRPNQEGQKSHRYPSKPDNFRKFDNRKHHREYKRSENEINPVKVQEIMDFEQELLEEEASFVQNVHEMNEPAGENVTVRITETVAERPNAKTPDKKPFKPYEKRAPKNQKPYEKPEKPFERNGEVSEQSGEKNQDVVTERLHVKANNRSNERHNEKWPFDRSIEKTYDKPYEKVSHKDKKEHEEKGAMIEVAGVRFRTAGKIYYFSPGEIKVNNGDNVIVETVRGVEFGKVVLAPRMIPDKAAFHPLKPVIRLANEEDYEQQRINAKRSKSMGLR